MAENISEIATKMSDDIEFPIESVFDEKEVNTETSDSDFMTSNLNLGPDIISKKEMLKDPSKRFWYLLQTFYKGGLMKTKDNNVMIQLYFHAVMGAYLNDYTVVTGVGTTDMRTPIIWIQDSSSGKSQLNKFGVDVARELGLQATETTDFTTAGLIGTHDKHANEYNRKNGLVPGETKVTGKRKDGTGGSRATYEDPIIYGDMKNYDIIFVDEGKILFQTGQHTENVLSILQPALDYPGRVRKKLAAKEPIEYESNCTLVTSTVEFNGLNAELMLQGFFPRCLFLLRKISFHQYAKMHEKICRQVFNENKYKDLIKDISYSIMSHPIEPIGRERQKIIMDEEWLEFVSNTVKNWFSIANKKLQGKEARIIAAFISRMHMFIYKIAGQVSVLNSNYKELPNGEKQFQIGMDELEYAVSILNVLFNGLVKGMGITETSYDRKTIETSSRIMQMMLTSNREDITKDEMVRGLKKIMRSSQGRANNMYEELVRGNYFNQDMTIRGKSIMVKPNWELYLEEKKHQRGGNEYEQY